VFYDASCSFCSGAAARWRGFLGRRGLTVLPLQSGEARRALGLREGEVPEEFKIVCERGIFGGADALLEIARRCWWGKPLAALGSIPSVRGILRRSYAAFAKHRHCLRGACQMGAAEHCHGGARTQ
jgi:predicted DCC family thiol-disulfide oxidoreductase YuxK